MPDIAVEVRSPRENGRFREKNIARSLVTGAVLDVDPKRRLIYTYDANGMRTFAPGERFETPLLPWLAFDVALVFRVLD